MAAVGNVLITSVRRRERDLGILKAIGFRPRQVASIIAWQATTFSVVALLIGLPLGIVGGKWAWNAVASNIGSAVTPIVPVLLVLMTVPATIAIAIALAAVPGFAASRIPPTAVMRDE